MSRALGGGGAVHLWKTSTFQKEGNVIMHANVCDFLLFLVNYRGSLGYGQDSVLSLPGNVGSQDVKDVQVKIIISASRII